MVFQLCWTVFRLEHADVTVKQHLTACIICTHQRHTLRRRFKASTMEMCALTFQTYRLEKCTWVFFFKEHKNTEPEVEFQQHFGFLHPTLNQAQTCWAAQSCSCVLPFSWKQSMYSLVRTLHFKAQYWFGGLPEERITKSATDYEDTAEVKVSRPDEWKWIPTKQNFKSIWGKTEPDWVTSKYLRECGWK